MTNSYRIFTLSLILLLLMLTLFLDKLSQVNVEHHKLDPSKPEYTINDFSATRFDLDGNIEERLNAKKMWQYPQSDEHFFLKPIIFSYEKAQLKYKVVAEQGQYNNKIKKAYFDKQVSIFIPSDAKNPASRIDTSQMWVDSANEIAESKQNVAFESGQSHGSAVGFKYDHKKQLLSLLSKVKMTYVKPK